MGGVESGWGPRIYLDEALVSRASGSVICYERREVSRAVAWRCSRWWGSESWLTFPCRFPILP